MDPEKALRKVRSGEKEHTTLVSFFGDNSFGWIWNDLISGFAEHYDRLSIKGKTAVRNSVLANGIKRSIAEVLGSCKRRNIRL